MAASWNTDPVKAIQTSRLKKRVYELLTAQQRLLEGVLAKGLVQSFLKASRWSRSLWKASCAFQGCVQAAIVGTFTGLVKAVIGAGFLIKLFQGIDSD